MAELIHAVMCGGAGTRLWPWSRKDYPKPFLSLLGEASLFQTTVDRIAGIGADVHTVAFAAEDQRFLVAEQLRGTATECAQIVLEPEARNTAPVAIIAALVALERSGPDTLVLLSPADHHIADAALFCAMIERALAVAWDGRIVTFGIRPDRASTAFGYIGVGEALPGHPAFHSIARFKEKPDTETAEAFMSDGGWLWNSGIFLFAPETLLAIASDRRPEMVALCRLAHGKGRGDDDFFRLDAESFRGITCEPFDRAIMENIVAQGAVTAFAGGWSDVGSWEAMRNSMKEGVATGINGRGPIETFDCETVLALSDGPLIVAHGLKDTVVVASPDAVYVGSANASQGLSDIVPELARRGFTQATTHEWAHHPWGSSKHIMSGEGFDISEIVVKPRGVLSSPAGKPGSAHWVLVRGPARVTVGDDVRLLQGGDSASIPKDVGHKLENPGETPIRIIAVRTGDD